MCRPGELSGGIGKRRPGPVFRRVVVRDASAGGGIPADQAAVGPQCGVSERGADQRAPYEVHREVFAEVDARVADHHRADDHQPREPAAADRAAGEYGQRDDGRGVRRDGAVHAADGFGRDVDRPVAGDCLAAHDAQRIGRDVQPFERGGEHRARARFEIKEQAAQHSVALEDARHHVRESDRRQHQRREDQHAAPAAVPPYQPEDQSVKYLLKFLRLSNPALY